MRPGADCILPRHDEVRAEHIWPSRNEARIRLSVANHFHRGYLEAECKQQGQGWNIINEATMEPGVHHGQQGRGHDKAIGKSCPTIPQGGQGQVVVGKTGQDHGRRYLARASYTRRPGPGAERFW